MSDHDAVEPTSNDPSLHPSRRAVLRAGLLALSAAQLPDILLARAFAQGTPPVTGLVGIRTPAARSTSSRPVSAEPWV